MRNFVASLRAVRLSAHVFYALLLACIFPSLGKESQQRTRRKWSAKLLVILNVRTHPCGTESTKVNSGKLFTANHISWLDVFVINASTPARFVAKSEVDTWPLVGWLVRRTGTVFIKREYKRDTVRANTVISNYLLTGEDIVLFPQGTSTDGTRPVSFHSSLLQGAIDVGAPVHPVAIFYHDSDGKLIEEVAFTGEMTFFDSLWKVLCLPALCAGVTYLPGIATLGASRRELAINTQNTVNATLASHNRLHAKFSIQSQEGLEEGLASNRLAS
jgi:1-acyl-sn-glycerol-3-phosphate acyltransferase